MMFEKKERITCHQPPDHIRSKPCRRRDDLRLVLNLGEIRIVKLSRMTETYF